MTDSEKFDMRREFEKQICPLLNQLLDLCNKLDLPAIWLFGLTADGTVLMTTSSYLAGKNDVPVDKLIAVFMETVATHQKRRLSDVLRGVRTELALEAFNEGIGRPEEKN